MSDVGISPTGDLDEALDALADMVRQHGIEDEADRTLISSGALSADADAMRLLARNGRFHIVRQYGRAVVGRLTERGA